MNETIKLSNGYSADVHYDQSPANPFAEWDCEPPIAVLNHSRFHSRLENYKGPELSILVLLRHLPAQMWQSREGKRAILAALGLEPSYIARVMRGDRCSFADALSDLLPVPYGWGEWVEYFDRMKALADLAGIPCHLTQSNGYSQGDCALVFSAALPGWVSAVGASPDTLQAQVEAACDLWTAWAWGDVYGVAAIYRPDGTELDDGSCWGFYGSDHEESGLMEHCESEVEADLACLEREACASHEAACRDILTV